MVTIKTSPEFAVNIHWLMSLVVIVGAIGASLNVGVGRLPGGYELQQDVGTGQITFVQEMLNAGPA